MFDLCLVTDEKLCLGKSLFHVIERAVGGGVTMVQLREKNLSTKEFVIKALKIKVILKPFNVPLIINDRIDIALAVNAEGVHIGQNDIPFELARKIIPQSMLLGLSVENLAQVKEAEAYKVDYLGVSPVFSTPSKTDITSHWGLDGLRELRKVSSHKLIAIGGINASNAESVIKAGADGIAVISAICSAAEPMETSSELFQIIQNAKVMRDGETRDCGTMRR